MRKSLILTTVLIGVFHLIPTAAAQNWSGVKIASIEISDVTKDRSG